MALPVEKIELAQSVAVLVDVDNTIMDELFPSQNNLHLAEIIEYDAVTIEGEAAEYTTFRNTANIVQKDGFDTVKIAPANFNESISQGTIEAYLKRFGENPYGDVAGSVDPEARALLDGVAKLDLRRQVGTKKMMYEVLADHKITGGRINVNGGKEDIVFGIPAANKEQLNNGGDNIYWTDTSSSKPMANIKRIYEAMNIPPEMIVMNSTTYGLFIQGSDVVANPMQTDANKVQNFFVDANPTTGRNAYRAGQINHEGVVIDVWIERDIRKTGNTSVPYLKNNFVIFASRNGEVHYGGIPVADEANRRVSTIAAPFDVQDVFTTNPVGLSYVYKSAPLTVAKVGESYYSLNVGA